MMWLPTLHLNSKSELCHNSYNEDTIGKQGWGRSPDDDESDDEK